MSKAKPSLFKGLCCSSNGKQMSNTKIIEISKTERNDRKLSKDEVYSIRTGIEKSNTFGG